MAWLDKFFQGGYKNVAIAGALVAQESTLNFGNAFTAADNPAQSRTDLTFTGLATPTGSGLVHVTSNVADATAYHGTAAGQALFTAASGLDTTWAATTLDVSLSVTTPGRATVIGLQGNTLPVPTGSNSFVQWTGSALQWGAFAGDLASAPPALGQFVVGIQGRPFSPVGPSYGQVPMWNGQAWYPTSIATQQSTGTSSVVFASDLNGSTSINQWVASISGQGGVSQAVPVQGASTTLNWTGGPATLQKSGTSVLQLGAASTDFIAFGATPGSSAFIRCTANAGIIAVNGGIVLATDASNNTTLTSAGGALNFQTGVSTQDFTWSHGATHVVTLSHSTLGQWVYDASTSVTPQWTQNSTTSATAADMTFAPQQTSAGNPNHGRVLFNLGATSGSGRASYVSGQENGSFIWALGHNPSGGGYGMFWLGTSASTPTSSNYTLANDTSTNGVILNGATGSTTQLAINGTPIQTLSATTINCYQPVGGPSGTAFSWQQSGAITLSNANVTLSSAQLATPVIPLTGTLTGNVTLIFPNTSGFWLVDFTGLSLSTFTVSFKSGTTTTTGGVSSSTFGSSGQALAVVITRGSNTVAFLA